VEFVFKKKEENKKVIIFVVCNHSGICIIKTLPEEKKNKKPIKNEQINKREYIF
jgi:hypothetical protein